MEADFRLNEAQSLLAEIVASSDDAIISKTLEGTILTWNRGAERIFGYSGSEMVGRPITVIVPSDRLDEEMSMLEQLRRGERVDHYQTVRRSKDGRLIDVSVSVSAILDSSGQIVGAAKVARDITAQKQIEQTLKEADRRKDEFLATLAHELRNPLAPIRNSLNILRLSEIPDPTVNQVLETMERQVNHLVRLVDDLIEVSRISRGAFELHKERVDLGDVICHAIDTSRLPIESAQVQLSVSLPDQPVILEADSVRLAQVFSNVLNNAARNTPKGGQIWLTARVMGETLEVAIRDTGVGIPADMLERVFDLFTQINAADRFRQGGLGIGLTLVRKLTEMHGGTVKAFSEGPGRGSEFVVRLPIAKSAPKSPNRPEGKPAHASAGLRVLVVDDNHDAANTQGRLLRFLGTKAEVVYDGKAALQALEAFHPDLVLMDIGMPDMDGYAVAQAIRRESAYDDILLVAVTGWGQEDDRRKSEAAGFDHHLTKPVDLVALRELVVAVGRREMARAVDTSS